MSNEENKFDDILKGINHALIGTDETNNRALAMLQHALKLHSIGALKLDGANIDFEELAKQIKQSYEEKIAKTPRNISECNTFVDRKLMEEDLAEGSLGRNRDYNK